MRILIADTAYPEFLKTAPIGSGTYEEELRSFLSRQFGTFYAYSRNLASLGHECIDVIVNHESLQQLWSKEHLCFSDIFEAQIKHYDPDVILLQDLSIAVNKTDRILAAQCSCRPPDKIPPLDVVFSSLPNLIQHFDGLGIRTLFLPLAFEPSVLDGPQPTRDIDISFVGGVGRDLHWRKGTETLELIAEEFGESFHWYGYGLERLPSGSALRACYRGPAWGREMYSIYRRSRIVVNRHGEIADGHANNLRMFEATGCGAMLLTEEAANLKDFFNDSECVHYNSPAQAVELIREFIADDDRRESVAYAGQMRTLRDHTYAERMKPVSETLKRMWWPSIVSGKYRELEESEISEVADTCAQAWQDPRIPMRQFEVVKPELDQLRQGIRCQPFESFLKCIYHVPGDVMSARPRFLDIGASSGYYYEVMMIGGYDVQYTAVDYSRSFERFAEAIYPQLDFDVANACKLPYRDNFFDVVMSGAAIMHIYDWRKAIAEAVRVAKRYVLFHRTAVLFDKPTTAYLKEGYGIPMFEWHFNECEFLSICRDAVSLELRFECEVFRDGQFGHKSYLFEKTETFHDPL